MFSVIIKLCVHSSQMWSWYQRISSLCTVVTSDFRGCVLSCWRPSVPYLQSATRLNSYYKRMEVHRDPCTTVFKTVQSIMFLSLHCLYCITMSTIFCECMLCRFLTLHSFYLYLYMFMKGTLGKNMEVKVLQLECCFRFKAEKIYDCLKVTL